MKTIIVGSVSCIEFSQRLKSFAEATTVSFSEAKENMEKLKKGFSDSTLTLQRVHHEIDLIKFRSEIESNKIYSNLKQYRNVKRK